MPARNLVISDGLLYVQDGDSYRLVTVEAKDARLRNAYRRATGRHNRDRLKPERLPDGEYYYLDGAMKPMNAATKEGTHA